jgi:hypothetical protein
VGQRDGACGWYRVPARTILHLVFASTRRELHGQRDLERGGPADCPTGSYRRNGPRDIGWTCRDGIQRGTRGIELKELAPVRLHPP